MEWIENTKDFILLDGRILAAKIREKPEHERKLWEKSYLWFHDNFEMVIIIGGLILLVLLIYNHLDDKCASRPGKNNNNSITPQQQQGGQGETPNNNSGTAQVSIGKTKDELRAEAMKQAAETAQTAAAAKAEKKNKGQPQDGNTNSDKTAGATENDKSVDKKKGIKSSIKNISGAAAGKASVALELGKEKFSDALYNSKDFIRQHAKAGYALAFTVFMVAGFGLFFVPTLIMFIIGGITLAIFNKQKMVFLANT